MTKEDESADAAIPPFYMTVIYYRYQRSDGESIEKFLSIRSELVAWFRKLGCRCIFNSWFYIVSINTGIASRSNYVADIFTIHLLTIITIEYYPEYRCQNIQEQITTNPELGIFYIPFVWKEFGMFHVVRCSGNQSANSPH